MHSRKSISTSLSYLLLSGILLGACSPGKGPTEQGEVAVEQKLPPTGPYLGQEPPGSRPELFAPGIVSTGLAERDFAMTPDGTEIYYTSVLGSGFNFSAIVTVKQTDGQWIGPTVAPFSGRFKDLAPTISPDGQRFLFVSTRPMPGSSEILENEDIWEMNRESHGWSEPRNLGAPINTQQAEFFPSLARDGTLYFTRRSEDRTEAIYRSAWLDDRYQEPERLGPEVNAAPTQFNAFIDPDQRFLIVCSWGRDDSLGGVDYYVVFRSSDDVWTGPINLGGSINTETGQEWSPYVSPDGKYFFFMSSRSAFDSGRVQTELTFEEIQNLHALPMNGNSDIWWVEAGFLDALRPDSALADH